MQLNDILEENSVKAISAKTKISEDNLENLLAKNFDKLKKVKTLGFISIIEREYHADLSDLHEDAQEYYGQVSEDKSITLGLPITEENKGTSKFKIFIVLTLFVVATWYFLTQFDKKNLSGLIPFVDEATLKNFMGSDDVVDIAQELKISNVSESNTDNAMIFDEAAKTAVATTSISNTKSETITDDESVMIAQTVTDITPETSEAEVETVEVPMKKIISIIPVRRLWFGLIDMDTKERKHFSIAEAYQLEVGIKRWLIATSSAPFFLKAGEKSEEFNDAKEHYLKIDEKGVMSLTKSEYVALGGWAQW